MLQSVGSRRVGHDLATEQQGAKISQYSTGTVPKFSDSLGQTVKKILNCFLQKASGDALLSTALWIESDPCPRQRSLSSVPSGITPL